MIAEVAGPHDRWVPTFFILDSEFNQRIQVSPNSIKQLQILWTLRTWTLEHRTKPRRYTKTTKVTVYHSLGMLPFDFRKHWNPSPRLTFLFHSLAGRNATAKTSERLDPKAFQREESSPNQTASTWRSVDRNPLWYTSSDLLESSSKPCWILWPWQAFLFGAGKSSTSISLQGPQFWTR